MQTARCLVLLALLATAAQGAEVYRTKAKDGSVTYSDRPENDNSDIVTVQSARAAGAQATAGQRTPRPGAQNAAGPRRADSAPEAAAPPAPLPPGPTAAELREQRQKNCDISKEREQRYVVSRRLFKTNDKGEREYLDDKAVAEARAKAAQDVKDWCG